MMRNHSGGSSVAKAVTVNQIRNVPFALALAFACAWMLDPSAAIPAGFASLRILFPIFPSPCNVARIRRLGPVSPPSQHFPQQQGVRCCLLLTVLSRFFWRLGVLIAAGNFPGSSTLRLSLRNGALPSLSAHLVPQGACGAPPRRLPFNAHCLAVFCRHTAGTLHFASATCHILYCAPRNRPLPHEKNLYCALARKPYGYFALGRGRQN
mgnify:CR=1 FL=1